MRRQLPLWWKRETSLSTMLVLQARSAAALLAWPLYL